MLGESTLRPWAESCNLGFKSLPLPTSAFTKHFSPQFVLTVPLFRPARLRFTSQEGSSHSRHRGDRCLPLGRLWSGHKVQKNALFWYINIPQGGASSLRPWLRVEMPLIWWSLLVRWLLIWIGQDSSQPNLIRWNTLYESLCISNLSISKAHVPRPRAGPAVQGHRDRSQAAGPLSPQSRWPKPLQKWKLCNNMWSLNLSTSRF